MSPYRPLARNAPAQYWARGTDLCRGFARPCRASVPHPYLASHGRSSVRGTPHNPKHLSGVQSTVQPEMRAEQHPLLAVPSAQALHAYSSPRLACSLRTLLVATSNGTLLALPRSQALHQTSCLCAVRMMFADKTTLPAKALYSFTVVGCGCSNTILQHIL
jgi:hypothetical protein